MTPKFRTQEGKAGMSQPFSRIEEGKVWLTDRLIGCLNAKFVSRMCARGSEYGDCLLGFDALSTA